MVMAVYPLAHLSYELISGHQYISICKTEYFNIVFELTVVSFRRTHNMTSKDMPSSEQDISLLRNFLYSFNILSRTR